MPSITQGMERYARSTGAESADVRIRVRYCREGKFLPPAARKSTTPQFETIHAAIMVLVHTVGGVQTTAVERMCKLWHLPLDPSEPEWSGNSRPSTVSRDSLMGLSAGLAFAAMIEASINPFLGSPEFQVEFPTISISHKADWIKLWGNKSYNTPDVWFCAPELRPSVPFGTGCLSPFISSTTITTLVFSELANIVRDSRREAFSHRVSIPTEDACQALGSEPPVNTYWRDRQRQQVLPLDAPTSAKMLESEEASVLPGTPAPSVTTTSTDDTRSDADIPTREASLHNADATSCVCVPSRGVHPSSYRTRRHDTYPTPHHVTCL